MYLKITKTNEIVDCIENPFFVEWNEKNRMYLSTEAEPDGVVSRNGDVIYQIREIKDNPSEVYTMSEITKDEYDFFIASLPKPEKKYTLDEAATIIVQEVSEK